MIYNRATSVPGSVVGTVRSGCCVGGSALSNPGSRKVAGETLWLALMPLQPVLNNASTGMQLSPSTFQFDLTEPQYRDTYGMRKE